MEQIVVVVSSKQSAGCCRCTPLFPPQLDDHVGLHFLIHSPYRLRFFHTHTGERLNIVYRHGDTYDPNALVTMSHYLRDHRTGDVRECDPRLFDLLHDLTIALGRPNAEIDVVCGYRTSWSNEYLRTHGHGVARHGLHMQAMAIDIRIPAVPTSELRDAALALHRGGVGYYASSDFVHVDVGRVRSLVVCYLGYG